MLKILTILGARPQIIKAAALSRAIRNKFSDKIREIILHTGQHYDKNMSGVFFEEMNIPHPDYNLKAGSGSHGRQTASMITGIEEVILKEQPDCVVVYGDTNSTLAAAVTASKLFIPIVHIEAGLRSFNKTMPEEINRIVCDNVSTLLFSPTKSGIDNLIAEGFVKNNKPPYTIDNPKIYHCGDVMYDNSMFFAETAAQKSSILKNYKLRRGEFVLATIHRDFNTDFPERLTSLFCAMNDIARREQLKIVIPLHPRTQKLLKANLDKKVFESVNANPLIHILPSVSFLDMIALEQNASLIMTDSGGVQKESFFCKKPCIILRPETEWIELVKNGNAIIADADIQKIIKGFYVLTKKKDFTYPDFYGNGKAAEFICEEILKLFTS